MRFDPFRCGKISLVLSGVIIAAIAGRPTLTAFLPAIRSLGENFGADSNQDAGKSKHLLSERVL
jgi:hypothetical protein